MDKVVLDLRSLHTSGELHGHLKKGLGLPDWYGGNLDALYDELTCIGRDTCIVLLLYDGEKHDVREYQDRVEKVFLDAEEENPCLCVVSIGLAE